MAGKNKKKKRNNLPEMIGISFVVLVLLTFMLVESHQLKERNVGYEQRVEVLDKEIERENERTSEIAGLESEVQTKEYAGEIARERLGLVGEGEIIFRAEN